jgi:hypothetical protein
MAQVVQCLPSEWKALNSNSIITPLSHLCDVTKILGLRDKALLCVIVTQRRV